jgi:hypothetical protein
MNAQPRQQNIRRKIIIEKARTQKKIIINEQFINMLQKEMNAYKEFILSQIKCLGASSFKDILHITFFNSVEYFISIKENSAFENFCFIVISNDRTDSNIMKAKKLIKKRNLEFIFEIFNTVEIKDFYNYNYQQIISNYFTMIKNFLVSMLSNLKCNTLIKDQAIKNWNSFSNHIVEIIDSDFHSIKTKTKLQSF